MLINVRFNNYHFYHTSQAKDLAKLIELFNRAGFPHPLTPRPSEATTTEYAAWEKVQHDFLAKIFPLNLEDLIKTDLEFQIVRGSYDTELSLTAQLIKRIDNLEDKIASKVFTAQQKQLHFHNDTEFLHSIDEVDLLEDGCTWDLQRKLNDGFHILAVCPQRDQRRPDYVLGKSNKKSALEGTLQEQVTVVNEVVPTQETLDKLEALGLGNPTSVFAPKCDLSLKQILSNSPSSNSQETSQPISTKDSNEIPF